MISRFEKNVATDVGFKMVSWICTTYLHEGVQQVVGTQERPRQGYRHVSPQPKGKVVAVIMPEIFPGEWTEGEDA